MSVFPSQEMAGIESDTLNLSLFRMLVWGFYAAEPTRPRLCCRRGELALGHARFRISVGHVSGGSRWLLFSRPV